MGRKPPSNQKSNTFSKKVAGQRFEAALRGSRIVGPNPVKTVTIKRGRPPNEDPMPKDYPEALIAWGKRNIQRD